ncbi:KGK domain-containing protein [Trichormus sp. NMC-1]|uniref:KGK domain-containing protein n=1 Tax=Trichormus sp. NMC-1 TaxID=1853259 RepID=UPI00191C4183|nr:KGK domain-containing protein [Trichormus sp. NMC-1]
MSESVKLEFSDVVTVPKQKSPLNASSFKVSEMSAYLAGLLVTYIRKDLTGWDSPGIECEVLQVSGGGWRKGKVRVSLDFIPDEPEEEPQEAVLLPPAKEKSPLDDLRAELLNNE